MMATTQTHANLQKAIAHITLIHLQLLRFSREVKEIEEFRKQLTKPEIELLEKYFNFSNSFNPPSFPSLKKNKN